MRSRPDAQGSSKKGRMQRQREKQGQNKHLVLNAKGKGQTQREVTKFQEMIVRVTRADGMITMRKTATHTVSLRCTDVHSIHPVWVVQRHTHTPCQHVSFSDDVTVPAPVVRPGLEPTPGCYASDREQWGHGFRHSGTCRRRQEGDAGEPQNNPSSNSSSSVNPPGKCKRLHRVVSRSRQLVPRLDCPFQVLLQILKTRTGSEGGQRR